MVFTVSRQEPAHDVDPNGAIVRLAGTAPLTVEQRVQQAALACPLRTDEHDLEQLAVHKALLQVGKELNYVIHRGNLSGKGIVKRVKDEKPPSQRGLSGSAQHPSKYSSVSPVSELIDGGSLLSSRQSRRVRLSKLESNPTESGSCSSAMQPPRYSASSSESLPRDSGSSVSAVQ
eukprot:2900353-Rhodomonas_salina.2